MSIWIFLLWSVLILVTLVLLGLSILSLYLAIRVRRMLTVIELLKHKPGAWWSWSDILQGTDLQRPILVEVMADMIRVGYVITRDNPEAIAAQEAAYAKAERIMASWEEVDDNNLEASRAWTGEIQKVQQELLEFFPTHLTLKQFRYVYQGPRRRKRLSREKRRWLWPEVGVYRPA